MYLLDTDTIIYSLKGHESVIKNLKNHIDDPVKISIITLMELYYGAYKSKHVVGNLAKIKTIESNFEIIPAGNESAEIFGRLKATLQKKGTSIDDFDLMIASCALANNLVLVTNNVKHFKRIESLKMDNWSV
jgi:tRNA(fMet)-specific endonuclease VapC